MPQTAYSPAAQRMQEEPFYWDPFKSQWDLGQNARELALNLPLFCSCGKITLAKDTIQR